MNDLPLVILLLVPLIEVDDELITEWFSKNDLVAWFRLYGLNQVSLVDHSNGSPTNHRPLIEDCLPSHYLATTIFGHLVIESLNHERRCYLPLLLRHLG
jgi:hypothetical protein